MSNFRAAILICVVAFSSSFVWAEKADRDRPAVMEGDSLRGDDIKRTWVITGNALLTKGTLLVRGAKIDMRQDAQGYDYAIATAETGKRAFFRQKREGVDEHIEAEATTIEYDGKTDVVKFIGKATVRRLRGAVLADESNGELITFDNTSDVFTVNGAPAGQTGGRVRVVLTPKPRADAPPPPAPAPSPQLKVTPTTQR